MVFSRWEDTGSTNPTRTLLIESATTLRAIYRPSTAPPPSRLPWAITGLSVAALAGVILYRPKKKK